MTVRKKYSVTVAYPQLAAGMLQVCVLVCMLISASCHRSAKETETAMDYKTMIMTASTATLTSRYPATIRGRQDVDIYPQVSGKITHLCVEEGQRVRKGQVLFVIDQEPYRAALLTAQAAERAARAQVAAAELELKGKQNLFDKNVVSDYDLATATTALETSRANLEQAKAQRLNAQHCLGYTTIMSPTDGLVGKLPFRAGTLVSETMTKPLTTISDNREMYVYFSMSENELRALLTRYGGMERLVDSMSAITLELSDGTMYTHAGRIEAVSGVIDPETGAASVRCVFPNPEHLLLSGGIGKVVLGNDLEGVLIVPQTAVFEIQDKAFAYRLAGGKPELTSVVIQDMNDGKNYIILDGLKEGDTIIKQGAAQMASDKH